MGSRWGRALARLHAQGEAAKAAATRVDEIAVGASTTHETAVAILYTADADYVRCAVRLLRAHLRGRRPPLRLPVAPMWPVFRDVWQDAAARRMGGVWRAIPDRALIERMRRAAPEPLLDAVISAAEDLQASLRGHRRRHRFHEAYIRDPDGTKRPAPTVPGFPDPGHVVNRMFPRGDGGLRIQPGKEEEFDRAGRDRYAVHERARAFGDAVLALLAAHHTDGVTPPAGRVRGAGRFVGREQQLNTVKPAWPDKLTPPQIVTAAGLGWLVLACAIVPFSVAWHAHLLDHHVVLLLAGICALGPLSIGIVYRLAPKLMTAPGPRAALPGAVAAVAALIISVGQGPVIGHYFKDPYDRYSQQYRTCLAHTPYAHAWTSIDHHVLTVTPGAGQPALRLGPARDGGIHPLHALDHTTRTVLDRHGC